MNDLKSDTLRWFHTRQDRDPDTCFEYTPDSRGNQSSKHILGDIHRTGFQCGQVGIGRSQHCFAPDKLHSRRKDLDRTVLTELESGPARNMLWRHLQNIQPSKRTLASD